LLEADAARPTRKAQVFLERVCPRAA